MHLGDPAPDFCAWTSINDREPFHFYRWLGDHWCIFFSHPADFSTILSIATIMLLILSFTLLVFCLAPVCTTELGHVAKLLPEFEKRHCQVLGLSTQGLEDHHHWIKDIEETQSCHVTFPIVADEDLAISKLYGMLDSPLHDPTNVNPRTGLPLTVRTVFIIDPQHRVRLMFTYPATVGRNFEEIIRCLDALQLVDRKPVATPANWRPGEDVLVRVEVSEEEARQKFASLRTIKPYLRYTKP